jgi:hypothetical protein
MFYAPLAMVSSKNSKRKTGGPPVYQNGLFEHIIDPSSNSLDNTFTIENSTDYSN